MQTQLLRCISKRSSPSLSLVLVQSSSLIIASLSSLSLFLLQISFRKERCGPRRYASVIPPVHTHFIIYFQSKHEEMRRTGHSLKSRGPTFHFYREEHSQSLIIYVLHTLHTTTHHYYHQMKK